MRIGGIACVLTIAACGQDGGARITSVGTFVDAGQDATATAGASTSGGGDGVDDGVDDGAPPTSTTSDGGLDSTSTGTAPPEPPDLSDGTWQWSAISNTPGISLYARRTILDDGRVFAAWADTDPQDLSVINIDAALGPSPWTQQPLTDAPDLQNTFPSLAGLNRALLVWSGRTSAADDLDIFLARSTGDAWELPENISNAFEDPLAPGADSEPVVQVRDDGGVAVAYLAAVDTGMGVPVPEVFVSTFFEDNAPSQRISLISPTTASCQRLAGAAAPTGSYHVVASCTHTGDALLIHGSDRSGQWDTDELGGVSTGVLSPDMSTGPEGVHLVWIQSVPCGASSCSEVFYAATDADDVFGTPIQATDTANLNERMPTVGVDPWGRALVFSQARVDNVTHVYLTLAEDGETFADTVRISPDGTDDYQGPHAVAFDADGNPSLVAEVVLDGSDPLNIEIYEGRFVPN